MNKGECLLVSGPPSSGKSTFAETLAENPGWISYDVEERMDQVYGAFDTNMYGEAELELAAKVFTSFAKRDESPARIRETIEQAKLGNPMHINVLYTCLAIALVMQDAYKESDAGNNVAISGYQFYQDPMFRLGARELLEKKGVNPLFVEISASRILMLARVLQKQKTGARSSMDLTNPAMLPMLVEMAEPVQQVENWRKIIRLDAAKLIDIKPEAALKLVA